MGNLTDLCDQINGAGQAMGQALKVRYVRNLGVGAAIDYLTAALELVVKDTQMRRRRPGPSGRNLHTCDVGAIRLGP